MGDVSEVKARRAAEFAAARAAANGLLALVPPPERAGADGASDSNAARAAAAVISEVGSAAGAPALAAHVAGNCGVGVDLAVPLCGGRSLRLRAADASAAAQQADSAGGQRGHERALRSLVATLESAGLQQAAHAARSHFGIAEDDLDSAGAVDHLVDTKLLATLQGSDAGSEQQRSGGVAALAGVDAATAKQAASKLESIMVCCRLRSMPLRLQLDSTTFIFG